MKEAASSGHLGVVQFLCDERRRRQSRGAENWLLGVSQLSRTELLGAAVRSGHFGVAKYLVAQGYVFNWRSVELLRYDAVSGNLAMIEWLCTQSKGIKTHWLDDAATAGHLEIVKWIHEHLPEDRCTANAMNVAASGGHLDVVQWLHENRSEGCTVQAMNDAATNGHLEIVQWLHTNRREGCSTEAMDGAAKNGHLEVVKWLHANRSEGCTARAMDCGIT